MFIKILFLIISSKWATRNPLKAGLARIVVILSISRVRNAPPLARQRHPDLGRIFSRANSGWPPIHMDILIDTF